MNSNNFISRKFMTRISAFVRAVRLWMTTASQALVVMLLGVAALTLAGNVWPPAHRIFDLIGESCFVFGGAWLLVGSVRVWWRMLRGAIDNG